MANESCTSNWRRHLANPRIGIVGRDFVMERSLARSDLLISPFDADFDRDMFAAKQLGSLVYEIMQRDGALFDVDYVPSVFETGVEIVVAEHYSSTLVA